MNGFTLKILSAAFLLTLLVEDSLQDADPLFGIGQSSRNRGRVTQGYGPPPKQKYGAPPKASYGPPPKQNYGAPPKPKYGAPPKQKYGSPPKKSKGRPPKQNYGAPMKKPRPTIPKLKIKRPQLLQNLIKKLPLNNQKGRRRPIFKGKPNKPKKTYGSPKAPKKTYGAPQKAPKKSYGAPPKAPKKSYGAPPKAPQQTYGAPSKAPQKSYGAPPKAPQQTYGAPSKAPEQTYGAPSKAPQQTYGAPSKAPQQTYGAPSKAPQQSYGAPSKAPQQSYGSPSKAPQQTYGAPANEPEQSYGSPAPQDMYGPPKADSIASDYNKEMSKSSFGVFNDIFDGGYSGNSAPSIEKSETVIPDVSYNAPSSSVPKTTKKPVTKTLKRDPSHFVSYNISFVSYHPKNTPSRATIHQQSSPKGGSTLNTYRQPSSNRPSTVPSYSAPSTTHLPPVQNYQAPVKPTMKETPAFSPSSYSQDNFFNAGSSFMKPSTNQNHFQPSSPAIQSQSVEKNNLFETMSNSQEFTPIISSGEYNANAAQNNGGNSVPTVEIKGAPGASNNYNGIFDSPDSDVSSLFNQFSVETIEIPSLEVLPLDDNINFPNDGATSLMEQFPPFGKSLHQ